MKERIKAVIFDQDGLMFDTEKLMAEAWKLAGSQMGVCVRESFLCTIRGMNHGDVWKQMQQEFGHDFDIAGLRERRRNYFMRLLRERGLPVKPGLKELLSYLKEQGYKIALASASSHDYVERNLKEAQVEEYFSHVVTGDQVRHAKPDPEIFLRAAQLLGEDPSRCLVLEDSLNGVEAGLRGGFVTVMVPDLTQPDQALIDRVCQVCSSLHEVKKLLEQTGGML